jgi:hypothetical protein
MPRLRGKGKYLQLYQLQQVAGFHSTCFVSLRHPSPCIMQDFSPEGTTNFANTLFLNELDRLAKCNQLKGRISSVFARGLPDQSPTLRLPHRDPSRSAGP